VALVRREVRHGRRRWRRAPARRFCSGRGGEAEVFFISP
jgi:hypothetical protein